MTRRRAALDNILASSEKEGKTPAVAVHTYGVSDLAELRIGIVEDHPIFLELLTSSLTSIPGFCVTSSATTVTETKKWFRPMELDVMVLDIELPDGNGVGLGVQMRTANPELAVVFLSDLNVLELVAGLPLEMRAGFSYLSKGATQSMEALAGVIRRAAGGEVVIDPTLVDRSRARPGTALASLTPRQFEIVRAVARGDSNQGIAEELGITVNSVGNHLISIYDTLGIPEGKNSRVVAVLKFLEDTHPGMGSSLRAT